MTIGAWLLSLKISNVEVDQVVVSEAAILSIKLSANL